MGGWVRWVGGWVRGTYPCAFFVDWEVVAGEVLEVLEEAGLVVVQVAEVDLCFLEWVNRWIEGQKAVGIGCWTSPWVGWVGWVGGRTDLSSVGRGGSVGGAGCGTRTRCLFESCG